MGGFFGKGGGGSSGPDTYTTWSDLPASDTDGTYAVLTSYDPQILVRYDTNNGWVPEGLYGGPALASVVSLNASDLSLNDTDPVSSWGGLTATGTLRPTYNATVGPANGAWVDFDGSNDELSGSTEALDGARYVVFAAIIKPDAVSNNALFAIGDSVAVVQLSLVNNLTLFLRTTESDGAASAVINSAAPSTSDWSVITCAIDYTADLARGLMGDDGDFSRDVPVPLVGAGDVTPGIVTTGTIAALDRDISVGRNAGGLTPFNGGLAYLGVWTADGMPTAVQLDALGERCWLEVIG